MDDKMVNMAAPDGGGDVAAAALTIGKEQAREAMTVLQRYKRGKANLEARIIENQKWYRLRHWELLRSKQNGENPEPVSAWLFNTVMNKHADAMDNYPEYNVMPREQSDEQDAKTISSVLPVVLERADFEQTYSDNWWDKLISGTAVYSPVWDSSIDNGVGDIAIRQIDLLNLFWEPGVQDIQKSRNVFFVELVDTDVLEDNYPVLRNKLSAKGFTLARYDYDDDVDTEDKSVLVHWYYKRKVGDKSVLHYAQICNEEVLFSSENEGYEDGWYAHGMYPFVMDVLFPEKGTPVGFGFVDICKDPQMYIDKLNGLILMNTALATNPRWFAQDNNPVNEEEYLDQSKKLVHVAGSLDETHLRKIDVEPVPGNTLNVLQMRIDEMKETSGNRDVSSGSTGGGVTAAAAIAALQEAGNKGSRDMINGSYRAYKKMGYMILELMRQFYDEPRYFRISAPNGAAEYVAFDNANMGNQVAVLDESGRPLYRKPIYDIKISAQKRSAISREVENQRATELYGAGFFNPERAQEAMIALDMMEFEGKDKVLEKVMQGQTLMNMLQQMSAQMQQMAAIIQSTTGIAQQPTDGSGSGGGGGKTAGGSSSIGAKTSDAMTKTSTPYAQQLASRATPDMSKARQGVSAQ